MAKPTDRFTITLKHVEFEPTMRDKSGTIGPIAGAYLVTFVLDELRSDPARRIEFPVLIAEQNVEAVDVVGVALRRLKWDMEGLAEQTADYGSKS